VAQCRGRCDSRGLARGSGDIEGDAVVSWLKTLLADAFFWTDNDLVVQTRSMYGGAPRAAARLRPTRVARSRTSTTSQRPYREAVVNALLRMRRRGSGSSGRCRSRRIIDGIRGCGRGAGAGADGDKPAVFVLPGILGGNLRSTASASAQLAPRQRPHAPRVQDRATRWRRARWGDRLTYDDLEGSRGVA
jgi:hypothetical protein